jgi:hypothetical protein
MKKGIFGIIDALDGKYKFKVTKDGFQALSSRIVVDHRAPPGRLSFKISVGT